MCNEESRMSPARPSETADLIAKPRLTVAEMTSLIAAAVAGLPSVRNVQVIEGVEVSVALTSGQRIEVQTLPVAARLNASRPDREAVLAEILGRCA
jgi:hypothetical protein